MRVFQADAAYLPFLVEVLQRAMQECALDARLRADESEKVQALASVPESLYAPTARGAVVVLIGAVNDSDRVNDLLVTAIRSGREREPVRDLRLVGGD